MEQYVVTGMSCAACSNRVEKAVSKVPGVTSCSVSLLTNSMGVEGTASSDAVIAAVKNAGYGASLKSAASKKSSTASASAQEELLEEPAFTCDRESGFYAEASLLYPAPGVLAEEDRICTCNPSPAEGEEHQKDCPLYVEQTWFESDTADLIITKQNMDEGQSSIFDVTGPDGYSKRIVINGSSSVTIKGLKSGTYTVTDVIAWQHTAGSNSQSVTLQSR